MTQNKVYRKEMRMYRTLAKCINRIPDVITYSVIAIVACIVLIFSL